jgi:hypothetical protein
MGGLTPVALRTDTAVTNHDYRDGRAVPVQSILQAGTAVLIDERGVPRVRCACGNPLGPPDHQPVTSYEVDLPPWPGFSSRRVTVIEPATEEVTEFFLVMPDGDTVPHNDVVVVRPRATQGEHDHPASPTEAAAARELPTAPLGGPSSSGPAETSGPGRSGSTPPESQSPDLPSSEPAAQSSPSTPTSGEPPVEEPPVEEPPVEEPPVEEPPVEEPTAAPGVG